MNADEANRREEILKQLAEAGEITRASAPKRGWTWRVKGLGLPPGSASLVLDEIRADTPLRTDDA